MLDEAFSETTNAVAARVPCDPQLVRAYAASGWLECRTLASGMRLFKPSASERVRAIRAERLARRGKYKRHEKVAAP